MKAMKTHIKGVPIEDGSFALSQQLHDTLKVAIVSDITYVQGFI